MTTVVHGQTFSVSGSAFGSKASNRHVFDDASGSSPGDIWDYAWPDAAPSGYNMAYFNQAGTPPNVPLPHSHVTKYLAGAHHTSGVHTGTFVHLAMDYNFVSGNFTRFEHYERLGTGWVFDSPASLNNHKRFCFSRGNGSPLGDGTYQAYYEFRGSTDFSSESGDFQNHTNDDSPGNAWAVNYYGIQANPFTDWRKSGLKVKWHASSGLLYLEIDQSIMINAAGQTDALPGTIARCQGIGTYSGNRNPANWRYFADVYYDYGPDDGAFYLTDNAVWASRTISEVQPYIKANWTSSNVDLTCNAGRLSNGTVYLFYRSDVNGNQGPLGSFTLAASGGGGGGTFSKRILVRNGSSIIRVGKV